MDHIIWYNNMDAMFDNDGLCMILLVLWLLIISSIDWEMVCDIICF